MAYRLTHGCIRQDESPMSRDVGDPEDFETEEEAEDRLRKLSRYYQSIGYKIWWSNIKKVD